MSNEHLTYFKVENFKRFDSLELTDIGQFNLIVGDNNVGKTSLLEALLFDVDRKKCLSNLHQTLFLKGLNIKPILIYGHRGEIVEIRYPDENFLRYIFNELHQTLIFTFNIVDKRDLGGTVSIEMIHSSQITDDLLESGPDVFFTGHTTDNRYLAFESSGGYNFEYDEKTASGGPAPIGITEYAGLYEHIVNQEKEGGMPFISTSINNRDDLSKAYFEQVDLSRKEKKQLIEVMSFLLPEIEDFEVRKIAGEDQLLVGIKERDELMPISTFGESVTRATQIMLEISKYRGKRLMIDEIDTGIHYSRMKNFLKTVFQVAQKNDVQLFMTTHSRECQQAFAEVFEESDMAQYQEKVRQFTLVEKQDGQVAAITRNFGQLEFALQTDNETRGGR
ncbi:MAG TPA: AAA family ATPase [Smithellaceae bacterium]|nr:AAA family ATPase [Smithellaceae bacterium]